MPAPHRPSRARRRARAAAFAAAVGVSVFALFASAVPANADVPKPGDTAEFAYTAGEPGTGWQYRSLNGLRVYCVEYVAGEKVGLTFTLQAGGEAELDEKAIWVLVHAGMVTPEQFAVESGVTGLTLRQLQDAAQVAIWYAIGDLTTSGAAATDPVTVLKAVIGSAAAPPNQVAALQWLMTNMVDASPTSEVGTIDIAAADGYHFEPEGVTGPLEVTASSGITAVLLSTSAGQVVDSAGEPLEGVTPGQKFFVDGAGESAVITAAATNVYAPGWKWIPAEKGYQPLTFAVPTTVSASFPLPSADPREDEPVATPLPSSPPQQGESPSGSGPRIAPASVDVGSRAGAPGATVNTGGQLAGEHATADRTWVIPAAALLLGSGALLVTALHHRRRTV